MLSSITPLGQRGRGGSWGRTVLSFWVGAVLVGAVVFGIVGGLGELAGLDELGLWVALIALALAALLDLAGVRVLGPHRQVDENWLGRYRDWVVGLGYGGQLGAGFITYVTTYGTWALFALAAISGPVLGVALGAAFGVGRSLLLMRTRRVGSPGHLAEMMQRFSRTESATRWLALTGYAATIVIVGLHVA